MEEPNEHAPPIATFTTYYSRCDRERHDELEPALEVEGGASRRRADDAGVAQSPQSTDLNEYKRTRNGLRSQGVAVCREDRASIQDLNICLSRRNVAGVLRWMTVAHRAPAAAGEFDLNHTQFNNMVRCARVQGMWETLVCLLMHGRGGASGLLEVEKRQLLDASRDVLAHGLNSSPLSLARAQICSVLITSYGMKSMRTKLTPGRIHALHTAAAGEELVKTLCRVIESDDVVALAYIALTRFHNSPHTLSLLETKYDVPSVEGLEGCARLQEVEEEQVERRQRFPTRPSYACEMQELERDAREGQEEEEEEETDDVRHRQRSKRIRLTRKRERPTTPWYAGEGSQSTPPLGSTFCEFHNATNEVEVELACERVVSHALNHRRATLLEYAVMITATGCAFFLQEFLAGRLGSVNVTERALTK